MGQNEAASLREEQKKNVSDHCSVRVSEHKNVVQQKSAMAFKPPRFPTVDNSTNFT